MLTSGILVWSEQCLMLYHALQLKIPELQRMSLKWVFLSTLFSRLVQVTSFIFNHLLENYHRLHALLSQLKISVLEAERKEAKQRYQEALQSYVIQYFGRPLEKLNVKLA